MLPDLYFRVGSRRNYNARRKRLACYIEQIKRPRAESLEAAESDNIKLTDSMPIVTCVALSPPFSTVFQFLLSS